MQMQRRNTPAAAAKWYAALQTIELDSSEVVVPPPAVVMSDVTISD